MHVYIYMNIYVCVYRCSCICVYMYICICMYINMYRTFIFTCLCAYTYVYVCVYIHTRGIVTFNFSPRNLTQVTSTMKPGQDSMFGFSSVKRITLREGLY